MTQSAVPNRRAARWRSNLLRWETFLLLVTALVFLFNSFASPYFLDPWNLSDATFNFTEKAIIALPMAMLIICREIDLSVASIIALASVCMGMAAEAGFGAGALVGIAVAVGIACGLFNGLVVTGFGIPSIVVTIGTMSLYRGITYVILGDGAYTDYPAEFAFFGQGYVYWVFSFEFVLFLVLALVFYGLLHRTNFGRRTYAIGNNPTAALYSGIKVNRHKLILFVAVGALSGLASVLLTSRLGSTRPSIAFGWELSIVTMVVLGGVSILGGAGSMLGVVIAVFLMGLVTFGLGLLNVPGIVMSVIIGAMLIAVISIPIVLGRWRAARESAR
ncbi:ABC transporter permease [Saccharospirillum mangrovi]|uniref:ABC transporter permease n=1 Tax=Saccharospirillum mangrovi TaxID=2161747 RepID=UPI001E491ED2|nr:ABC transporter permease [Saccharospirillum mangrovi]